MQLEQVSQYYRYRSRCWYWYRNKQSSRCRIARQPEADGKISKNPDYLVVHLQRQQLFMDLLSVF